MALSTQPYKGARDFYPEDKRIQKYMFAKLRETAELFGYEEYDAPILEPLDIYLAKSGEEIVNEQTYTFEDRGGRKVVIRPEMTPTVSRMVAAKRQELGYPLRWYSIPNLWRYERPQRGRLREHWQLNIDIFGVDNSSAETEIVTLIDATFKNFGASPDMYQIKINSRELVTYLLTDYLQLSEQQTHDVSKLIDRIHKMERNQFIAKIEELLSAESKKRGTTEKLLSILDAKNISELPTEAQAQASAKDLEAMIKQLETAGITNAVFDITIMRGFDYYTGIVFEVNDTHPHNNRSMLGGGRYDGLVGMFGVDPVPTVGFGWGDVTLQNFLELHHLMPALKPEVDLYVLLAGITPDQVQPVVAQMREQGLKTAIDLSGRKLSDQFKTADKKGYEHVCIVGENELKTGQYIFKYLPTGDEMTCNISAIVKLFRDHASH